MDGRRRREDRCAGMSAAPTDIADEVQQWITDVSNASQIQLHQVSGGASRQAWFVDAHTSSGVRDLFLRYDPREPRPNSAFHPLQVEAEIMSELHRHGVTVPRVIAAHPTAQAVLMDRVVGQTWFRLIKDPDEQVSVARDFIAKLAHLHRIDARDLVLPQLGSAGPVAEHVAAEIAAMRRRVHNHGRPAPLLTFCINWLERHVPDYDGPTVLVQGDTGPGNFMYADGHVTAIVDWELAHFGDPMDDIAWLSLRTVQDTFTDFPSRLAEYEQLSWHRIDEYRVWYYRLFAETRLASMNPSSVDTRASVSASSPDAGNSLIYGMLHRRLLVEALAHALHIPDEPLEISALEEEFEAGCVYDAAASALSHAEARSADALASRYIKGAARLIRYAAEVHRAGSVVDAQEIDELARLLGRAPDSVAAGRAALAELASRGAIDERDYVAQLWRGIKRDDFLTRAASGALRHRTWPPLNQPAEKGEHPWASQSPTTIAH
jgi:prepilin-type processing-associated H-X9-DG protein